MVQRRKQWIVGSKPLFIFFLLMLLRECLSMLQMVAMILISRNIGISELGGKFALLSMFNAAISFLNSGLILVALYQLVRFAKAYKELNEEKQTFL